MEFSSILKTVAPWIGAAITGPAGPLVGIAAKAAAGVLGANAETKDAVEKAFSGATQEQLLALKQADQDFAIKMQEMGYKNVADLEALAVDDRKSARDMQKAIRSKIPAALSIIVTVGFLGLLAGMTFGKVNPADSQALLMMLGSLTTGWGSVMAFWLGSTNGGQMKTEMLAKSSPAK